MITLDYRIINSTPDCEETTFVRQTYKDDEAGQRRFKDLMAEGHVKEVQLTWTRAYKPPMREGRTLVDEIYNPR
jgi:hypothetical protein